MLLDKKDYGLLGSHSDVWYTNKKILEPSATFLLKLWVEREKIFIIGKYH